MPKIDINKLSKHYSVRRMTMADVPSIFELCKGNKLFYEYCGARCSEEQIVSDMSILPPQKTLDDKYYIGFFKENTLIAVMDLIDGFPDESTAYIGFFMMNADFQGRGYGSSLIAEVCGYLKNAGFSSARLAFDKFNPQSSRFWRKNGFLDIKEAPQGDGVVIVAERKL